MCLGGVATCGAPSVCAVVNYATINAVGERIPPIAVGLPDVQVCAAEGSRSATPTGRLFDHANVPGEADAPPRLFPADWSLVVGDAPLGGGGGGPRS
jgi:hypothetical protein